MSNITNNFEPGSVTMNAGSSMNGDVHIGNVYNGKADVKTEEKDSLSIGSPLHLSKKATKRVSKKDAWKCGCPTTPPLFGTAFSPSPMP